MTYFSSDHSRKNLRTASLIEIPSRAAASFAAAHSLSGMRMARGVVLATGDGVERFGVPLRLGAGGVQAALAVTV